MKILLLFLTLTLFSGCGTVAYYRNCEIAGQADNQPLFKGCKRL